MKHTKRVLAVLLALVMVLSCVGMAFATEKPAGKEVSLKTAATEISGTKIDGKEETLKGFKSIDFLKENTYQYADDEIVRAIVILEGDTEADAGTIGSIQAIGQHMTLEAQHKNVFKAMAGIEYDLKYEYTRLLNGFSCDVAYGDLEAISAIDGVSSVHIANSYSKPVIKTPVSTDQFNANELVGNNIMHNAGWTGAGTVIAVLDTGLNLEHEAFQDLPGWVEPVVTQATVASAKLLTNGKYISEKIPYSYDYADHDDDVTDHDGHGTHVSGSAVGLAGELAEDGKSFNVTFAGAAPAAQLLSMKIFHDDKPGTTIDIYFYALEDAYTLGADVINMSIGSQNGFTYDSSLETDIFGNIYERLTEAGVILSVAAGNEYSMAANAASYNGYAQAIGPDYTDYGTVASPSTYNGNVSVASMENTAYPDFVVRIDGEDAPYYDSCSDGVHGWIQNFAEQKLEYQVLLNADGKISLGVAEDYAAYEEGALAGKIVIVSRGEIDFETKVENAANAGAIGCIVVNNAAGSISMSIETFEIPAISLQMSALELLSVTGVIEVPSEKVFVPNPTALLMSDFSNWGTSPMLTLDPAITGVGGRVYSSVPGGTNTYEVYSGTSMAAPNMTGMYAALLSAIYEQYPDMEKTEAAELAKDLVYSSATMLKDADGYYYSPRKTGAGMASGYAAISSLKKSAYITNPLQELGDDPAKTGVYQMSLELKNDSIHDLFYGDFEAYVLHDYLYQDAQGTLINTLTSDYADADVVYTIDGVEVTEFALAAGESVTVDVTITLSEEQKAYFDACYPNGSFVEGYVVFNEIFKGSVYSSSHATFLAYYGDWTQANVLEKADFMDIIEVDGFLNTTVATPNGETYADLGYNWANCGLIDFYTNPNNAYITNAAATRAYAYAGDNMLGYVPYYPEHIAFSTPETNGTYNYAQAIYMEPFLLRNARHLIMTVTDKVTGEVYYVDDTEYLPKAVYDSDYASWFATGAFVWDGKDAEGNYVPSGTVATITYDAVLPYGEAEQQNIWGFDVTVDYTAPVLEEIIFDEETATLTVTASDENYLQAIYLANDYGEILAQEAFSSDVKGESFTASFDVSDQIALGNSTVHVVALDYATNEMEELGYFFQTGLPATITLNTPYGAKVYEVETGDRFTFPAAPAIANGNFMFWAPHSVDYVDASGYDIYYMVEMPWYFEGDPILIDGDVEVYALYMAGEIKEYEEYNYYYTQDRDSTGTYALCGWNYDAESGNYLTNDPVALNSGLTKTVVSEIENAVIGDHYIEFFTSDPSIAFNLTKDSQGLYTIQSADGKYMALADGKLAMVEQVTDAAKWNISVSATSYGMLIYNAAQENMILLYNDDEKEFQVMDDSQPIAWIQEQLGLVYYPSQVYQLLTYACQTTYVDEASSFYTTVGEFELIPGSWTPFDDVPADSFYFDSVAWAVENGIITGATTSTFNPNGKLLRAQAVTMLWRAAGEPMPETTVNPFTDVSESDWYYNAVLWAVENEITTGISADKFAPFSVTTREQALTFLWRYLGQPETDGTNAFTDVAAGSWYEPAINWAVANNVTTGIGNDTFGTGLSCNRAQMVTFLYRSISEN